MDKFYQREVPIILRNEDAINQQYQDFKQKQRTLDDVKKECQDHRQELVAIGTQRLNFEEEKRVEREQMEDLVSFAKSNAEKYEKRINDTKAEIEKSKAEKRKEEENIRAL